MPSCTLLDFRFPSSPFLRPSDFVSSHPNHRTTTAIPFSDAASRFILGHVPFLFLLSYVPPPLPFSSDVAPVSRLRSRSNFFASHCTTTAFLARAAAPCTVFVLYSCDGRFSTFLSREVSTIACICVLVFRISPSFYPFFNISSSIVFTTFDLYSSHLQSNRRPRRSVSNSKTRDAF